MTSAALPGQTSGAPAEQAAPAPAAAARAPWLWGRGTDLAVFGGSAAVALALAALAPALSKGGALPTWGWIAFVVAVDVAHVHTTLFRTYLDRDELRRRRALYLGVPLACYLAGVGLHLASSLTFWRALAYVAVFHFVRQQAGWVAIYRALAGERSRVDRLLDNALVYAATGWPLLHWHAHAHLPRSFRWFVEGDFVAAPWLAALVGPLGAAYAAIGALYVARAAQRALQGAAVNVGKHVVIAATAATWYVGIVGTDGDFAFTVTNVITHGVPYMALLFAYARERAREAPGGLVARIVDPLAPLAPRRAARVPTWAYGAAAFVGVALLLAFAEEMLWDRLVWHDRPEIFGGDRERPLLGAIGSALVVPLLAVPQATHYVLDAVLWRRGDTGPAQARALGFRR